MRATCHANIYLLLMKDDQLLLSLRHNTGYMDGKYSLVAGHIEKDESAIQAMIREAKEEIGITISPENLSFAHVMHRKSNRENVDIFLLCKSWKGEIINKEPNKCKGLLFCSPKEFPENTLDYIKDAYHYFKSGIHYSEAGWEV